MSYCRFSDNDFGCDAYIYHGIDGFMMHIAATRLAEPLPDTVHLTPNGPARSDISAWKTFFQARADNSPQLQTAARVSIDHREAGKTFRFDDLDDLLGKVIELKSQGIRIPEYVVETIREEIAEGNMD
jgi:hypothetical protein